ncbi:hypothetical protein C5167_023517 [Papaver somniferum]|uniref:F-box associated beta-propeller type 1 domain-containing protein n=1 Tax=Papaver somniferum TaxID=3469 RepID=A0A4Y7JPX1_PAPSO|nr:hypothetical protein C5167_023517 [Papaver somniferum]
MTYQPPSECYSLVGSCNGFICLNGLPAHFTHDDYDEFDPASNVAYVCNPITRETVMLPELKRRSCHDDRVDFLVIGFGYAPSTDEYKVVRLYKFMREPKFARIEVYTQGSGKGWRDEGKKIETGLGGWQHGVFANGWIYWNFGNGKIVAFDLADEMFVELSECPIFRCRRIRLGVLGDHLCATNSDTITNISDVWLLKKHKDESLMSWSKELSLTNMDGYDTPLAVTGSAKLLCHSNTSLYLYDLKSSSSKLLANFDRCFHQGLADEAAIRRKRSGQHIVRAAFERAITPKLLEDNIMDSLEEPYARTDRLHWTNRIILPTLVHSITTQEEFVTKETRTSHNHPPKVSKWRKQKAGIGSIRNRLGFESDLNYIYQTVQLCVAISRAAQRVGWVGYGLYPPPYPFTGG